jgi:hypothetical protein
MVHKKSLVELSECSRNTSPEKSNINHSIMGFGVKTTTG